ncbi:HNH endonuclease family protein [Salana multivorans]
MEIDHIVPVSVAWYYGASTWTDEKRNEFYNDMANLVAAGSQTNQAKGNKTLSQWVPPTDFVCEYTERYVGTHVRWNLAMPQADITKARDILAGC